MKCTITKKETESLTNNIPLSREGRDDLVEITAAYNDKLRDRFVESFIEKSGQRSEDMMDAVKKLAPKFSKKKILKLLVDNTREELFTPFERPDVAVESTDIEEVDEA